MPFLESKIIKPCNCIANKNAIFEYTFSTHYGNSKNIKDIDILILLEFKEIQKKMDIFIKLCNYYFKEKKYVIVPALGCTPNGFTSQDTINTYSICKQKNIKKIIEYYKPKTIITTGRAIYSITESKDLFPEHFFIPVNENIQSYELDDCWFYSSEFNCKIFPIPALYQWIENNIKDVYEYKFSIAQFQRTIDASIEILRSERKCQFIYEENPNDFIKKIIDDENIKVLSLDSETAGLNYFVDTLHSLQISIDSIYGHFLEFNKIDKKILKDLFNKKNLVVVMHHAQFDLKMLIRNGILNARCDFDTMLATHLLNENNPNGLKSLAWLYTKLGGYDFKLKQYLKKRKINDFTKLPKDLLLEYSCYDSIVTYRLYEYFTKRFELEDPDLKRNFYQFIMPAVEMIVDVEMTGVQIDIPYLNNYVDILKKQAEEIETEIYNIAGYRFNIKSGKELSKVLRSIKGFQVLLDQNNKPLLAKNGDLLLNKQVLDRYFNESDLPFIKKISEYNHITKEISQLGFSLEAKPQKQVKQTFLFEVDQEVEVEEKGFLASMYKGRLYGGYKLHGTETGRMAGGGGLDSSINWHNMPKIKEFRKMFLPSKGYVMAFADYNAMEVCINSQISGPGVLEELILEKKDMHCYTAVRLMELFDIKTSYEEVFSKTKIDGQEDSFFIKWREDAKINNFQGFYGATAYGLANAFNVSEEIGKKYLQAFYDAYPEVAVYIKNNREFAKKHGYVKTLLGRKRRLPQLTYIGKDSFFNKNNSSFDVGNLLNAAINAPVQGTSGQTTLIAMTNIWKEFKKRNLKSKILINVHDEIIFELLIEELKETCDIIKYWMEYSYYQNVNNNKVKLTVDVKYGEIWKYGYSIDYWENHPEEWEDCIQIIEDRNIKNKEVNCE